MVLRPIRPLFPLARILTKGEAIAMSAISNAVNAQADAQAITLQNEAVESRRSAPATAFEFLLSLKQQGLFNMPQPLPVGTHAGLK